MLFGVTPSGEANITALQRTEVATEADFEFTSQFNSESSANAEILSILNSVDALYQAQLNLTLSVVFQHSWMTSSDPYTTTDADSLLVEFTNYWQSNYSGTVTYDISRKTPRNSLELNTGTRIKYIPDTT